jgi:uracil phosphoribosyltransferase
LLTHRLIESEIAKQSWNTLQRTISREKAFQATETIGKLAAQDMLELSKKSSKEIDRIYVKLRDGMPMASGMKKALPHVDVRYIVSQEKQKDSAQHLPIFFWEGYDGYSSETVWFADPINATGHTTVESLRHVRKHFKFNTALISHVAANVAGIKTVQTTVDDFAMEGFMNYAYLSKKLDAKGYLKDGLDLIPDFGDKLFGTLGSDYSIYDIQERLKELIDTGVGEVEILKGTILHLIQIAKRDEYTADRTASWITRNWITAALQWYCAVEEFPYRKVTDQQASVLIDDLHYRDFLTIEKRPWKDGFACIYSLSEDGVNYASSVYIPILSHLGILQKLYKHFDFLVHLTPTEILENIKDQVWRL